LKKEFDLALRALKGRLEPSRFLRLRQKLIGSNLRNVISQKIRAFTSNPGAWTIFRSSTLKIFTPVISELELEPGQILIQDKRLFVGTATLALEIGGVQPSGKAQMAASSWDKWSTSYDR